MYTRRMPTRHSFSESESLSIYNLLQITRHLQGVHKKLSVSCERNDKCSISGTCIPSSRACGVSALIMASRTHNQWQGYGLA